MNYDNLKTVHELQLVIMDEIHNICQNNGISYYLIGGSALGAIRHEGFIPWDVDIDIAMMREDYDKFKQVCQTQLDERFYYDDYLTSKNFLHPHAVVCMKKTTLTFAIDKYNKWYSKNRDKSLYIDIFPLDVAPEDDGKKEKQKCKIKKLAKIKYNKVGLCYSSNRFKKIAKRVRSMMYACISIDKLNRLFACEIQRYNGEKSEYVCSMTSHYSYDKQLMKKEIYGKPKLVKFEDREYYIPERCEEYLTKIFGDYMKLPSEEQKRTTLDFYDEIIF